MVHYPAGRVRRWVNCDHKGIDIVTMVVVFKLCLMGTKGSECQEYIPPELFIQGRKDG